MTDRRRIVRQPIDVFFNKYLDGAPYLCRSVDLSPRGMLADVFGEPDELADSFPLELQLCDDQPRIWVWARRVRKDGKRQAFEFMAMDRDATRRLDRFLFAPA
ncbi:MAG: PilZ domain-containing protein [Sorangiineae bacterium]|nr:PilZ domain-containing protein [Polyangiaceae bacterium]MEB2324973.1 PilZ domain-containing protein [Sorangiineae bacterium]